MRSHEHEVRFIYLLYDIIILNLSILLLGWIRLDIGFQNYRQITIYLLLGNIALLYSYFIFLKNNLYLHDGYLNRIRRITKGSLTFFMILVLLGLLLLPHQYSLSFLFSFAALFYANQLVFYRILYTILKFRRKKGLNTIRLLIVGENQTTNLLQKIIRSNPMLGYSLIGFASDNPENGENLGSPEQLAELIKKHQIQMVFVCVSILSDQKQSHDYLNICSRLGVRLRFIPKNQRWFSSRLESEPRCDLILINPQEIPMDKLLNRGLKRIFDLLFSSAVLLLLFSWSFPIIALLIKLSSKGPVFFVQERTGINNKTFNCIKFRSMQVNRHADTHQAKLNDHRNTKIGNFLRRSNLDEFPQFINVFLGKMSVVGPRPHMLNHTKQYSHLIDHYLVRHYVKPGITGWAQVNGYRGLTDELWKMEKRVEFDMDYIENWSFGWDITIIWRTIFGFKTYINAG